MAMTDFASGRQITVRPVPKEITYFVLSDKFGWLPDEIERQDAKWIKAYTTMLSIYNEVRNREATKSSKKPQGKNMIYGDDVNKLHKAFGIDKTETKEI